MDHKLLLDKLEKYGVRGPGLSWIKLYLQDRRQCVKVTKLNDNNEVTNYQSDYKLNKAGVPQVSVLGPLLFILCINDLPDVTKHQCIMFADDVSIIINNTDNNLINYETDINNTLRNVINYLDINNLNVNLSKTNYIQFTTKGRTLLNLNIKYKNDLLAQVDKTTFLGFILDKGLHCTHRKGL